MRKITFEQFDSRCFTIENTAFNRKILEDNGLKPFNKDVVNYSFLEKSMLADCYKGHNELFEEVYELVIEGGIGL